MLKKVGSWSFIAGVFLAVVLPLFVPEMDARLTSLLVVLGLVVGFLNITAAETQTFLLAAVSLVIVSGFGSGSSVITEVVEIGPRLGRVFAGILAFVVPATIVVALRTIYKVAHEV